MTTQFFTQYGRLLFFTILCSIALSAWSVWVDPVVNNDGIIYFRAARAILMGDWHSAIKIFSWPAYPGLIALVQITTGVGEQTAAHVLNALFYCALVVGFLAVVHELGADRKTLVVAAILVLFFPTLNKYRSFVIRDVAYLALYMWSMMFLFRYWATKHKKNLMWWSLLTIGSIFFRVEGFALLMVVPLVLLTIEGVNTRFRWLFLGLCTLCMMLLAVVLIAWVYKNYMTLGDDNDTINITLFLSQAWTSLFTEVGEKMRILREEFSSNHYRLLYIAAIVFLAIAEIIRRLSVIYALLPIYGVVKKLTFPVPNTRVLWLGLIIINALVLIGSGVVKSLVVDRYAVATALTVLLAVPFVLVHLYELWKHQSTTYPRILWIFPVIVLVCGWLSIKSLDVFTQKKYLVDAGQWISKNIDPNAAFYSNNLILIYYTERDDYHANEDYSWRQTHWLIKYDKWKEYDYIALQIDKEDEPAIEWLRIHLERDPIKSFMNEKGDQMLVYHTRP